MGLATDPEPAERSQLRLRLPLGVLEPDGRFSFLTEPSGDGRHRPTEGHKA